MSDGKLAVFFFEAGIVLTLISMVLGPFEITGWALATASVACFVALAGMYLAFSSWDEPDEEVRPPEEPRDTETQEK